ncbi:extracellular solute-binding protein [Paenibacillus aurantius]|uniref:Extracellular solute-binding protein n=1 Tax=Paenibacillus aurantius TaxID=2918900 RepID=A0AA96RGN0_9BACL|nr:extracellular solute-binding protein [Paenibacillus aurantius]WNQ13212.1 extracellular solute-binding protein [Paenibacillus aurantius]
MTHSSRKQPFKRTWGPLLLAMTMMVSIVGCSGGTKSASSSPSASPSTSSSAKPGELNKDEKAELTLWATPSGTLPGQQAGDWIKSDLIKEWNKEYPNVKVNVEIVPFEGINEKVTTAIASKTTPDILLDYPGRTLAYGQMGALAPLDDVIPPADLEKIKKNPDVMKMVSVKGNIVTMPYSTTLVALILNKSLWKEAGAENLLPKDEFRTWTPEEFKAALKAVANKDKGVYGLTAFALNEQGDQLYYNTMTAFGAKLYNDDYTKYTAADSPEAEQALAFFQSLLDEGLITPHPETISSVNALDYYKQKKNGMVVGAAAHAEIVKSGLKDGSVVGPHEYMYVNYPSPKKGQSALKMETGFGVVFKKNDAQKEKWAKRFLYWMQVENPLYSNALKTFNPFGKAPAWTEGDPELQFLAKLSTKAKDWPIVDPGFGIKGYPEMRAAMFPEMQKMFIKYATPKQTIDNISKKFNDVIKKYNK